MKANLSNYRSYLARQCISYFKKRHDENAVARGNARAILNSFFYYGRIHRLFVAGKFPLDRGIKSKLQSRYL